MAPIHLSLRDHSEPWRAAAQQAEGPGGEMTQERPHSLCRSLQAREQASRLRARLFIYLFVYLVILLSPLRGFLFK